MRLRERLSKNPYLLNERWLRVAYTLSDTLPADVPIQEIGELLLDVKQVGGDRGLLQLSCKTEWFNSWRRSKNDDDPTLAYITGYFVWAPDRRHWYMCVLTNGGIWYRVELFGEKANDHTRTFILARNKGVISDKKDYIVPALTFNVERPNGDFIRVRPDSRVDFRFWLVAIMLDEQVYRPYDQFNNNCQQYLERLCTRCEWRLPATPNVEESIARPLRGNCGS